MSITAEEAKAEGNKHFRKKEFTEATVAYSEAIRLDPSNHVYYSNRAAAYMGMQDWENAIADATKCIEVNPQWPKGYFRLGSAYMGASKIQEAVEALQKGERLDPENEELKAKLRQALQQSRALAEKRLGEPITDAASAKAKGNAFFKEGQFDEAIECYSQALQLADADDPNKPTYHLNRAACYLQQRRYEEVVHDCDRCLKNDERNFKAYVRRGMAYQGMEKYKKALADFQMAREIDPSSTTITQNINECQRMIQMLG